MNSVIRQSRKSIFEGGTEITCGYRNNCTHAPLFSLDSPVVKKQGRHITHSVTAWSIPGLKGAQKVWNSIFEGDTLMNSVIRQSRKSIFEGGTEITCGYRNNCTHAPLFSLDSPVVKKNRVDTLHTQSQHGQFPASKGLPL